MRRHHVHDNSYKVINYFISLMFQRVCPLWLWWNIKLRQTWWWRMWWMFSILIWRPQEVGSATVRSLSTGDIKVHTHHGTLSLTKPHLLQKGQIFPLVPLHLEATFSQTKFHSLIPKICSHIMMQKYIQFNF